MILRLRIATMVLDALLVILAFLLAYAARVGFIDSTDFPFQPYMWSAVVTAFIWVGVLVVFRGYSTQRRLTELNQLLKVAVAGLTGTALFIGVFYFTQKVVFSRLLLVYSSLFGITLMVLFHVAVTWLEKSLIRKGYGNVRLLIIGSNRGVKHFIQLLKKNVSVYQPVAILDGYGTSQTEVAGVPVLGKLNILEKTVDDYHIDAIVQGDNLEQIINIILFCQNHRMNYFLLPDVMNMSHHQLEVKMCETPVIVVNRAGSESWLQKCIG